MASTIADIESAWRSAVLTHPTIANYTTNTLLHLPTFDSETEASEIYDGEEINFITCIINQSVRPIVSGGTSIVEAISTATVTYTIAKDTTGEAYTKAKGFPYTLQVLVNSELQDDWQNTVDYFVPQQTPAEVTTTNILNTECWTISFQFEAFKRITI